MRVWTLRAYRTSGGRDVLREWYDAQTEAVRGRFQVRVEFLLSAERLDWKREPYAPLTGHAGLGEIRFKADRVQHRPIGFFGPMQNAFTILICAKEIGGKFVPKQSCATAEARMSEILADHSKSVECEWLWKDDDDDQD